MINLLNKIYFKGENIMFFKTTGLLCLIVMIGLLALLLYYVVDSYKRKEYKYCVGFLFYTFLELLIIGKAVSLLLILF